MSDLADLGIRYAESSRLQSSFLLENFGITIEVTRLPTWAEYVQVRDRFYGTDRLSVFWAQRVRPWLMPKHHKRLEQEYREYQRIVQAEILNETIEKGSRCLT